MRPFEHNGRLPAYPAACKLPACHSPRDNSRQKAGYRNVNPQGERVARGLRLVVFSRLAVARSRLFKLFLCGGRPLAFLAAGQDRISARGAALYKQGGLPGKPAVRAAHGRKELAALRANPVVALNLRAAKIAKKAGLLTRHL